MRGHRVQPRDHTPPAMNQVACTLQRATYRHCEESDPPSRTPQCEPGELAMSDVGALAAVLDGARRVVVTGAGTAAVHPIPAATLIDEADPLALGVFGECK